MALPTLHRKLFRNDGYGPFLKPEIIPFASDLSSKDGSVAASTKWVKDLAVAEIYVDASVASSGGGYTAATAIKTIQEGVNLAKSLPGKTCRLVIAGGTYTETVYVSYGLNLIIDLRGNTTIIGDVRFDASTVFIDSNEYSSELTINGALFLSYGAILVNKKQLTVSSPRSDYGVLIDTGAILVNASYITVTTAENCAYGVAVVCATLTHVGTNTKLIINNSRGKPKNALCVMRNSAAELRNLTIDNSVTSRGLVVSENSYCALYGTNYIKTDRSSYTFSPVFVNNNSILIFYQGSNNEIYGGMGTTGSLIACYGNSLIDVDGTHKFYLYNGNSIFELQRLSEVRLVGTIKISGTVSYGFVLLQNTSVLSAEPSSSIGVVQDSSFTGRKYYMTRNSLIEVYGATDSKFPGSSAYSDSTSIFH